MRETIYLEKRNFNPIEEGIENNIDLCRSLVDLHEEGNILDEDLIHIASVIDGVKSGATFSDWKDNCLNEPHEIRNTGIYNTLVEFKIPFRIDILGNVESDIPHKVNNKNISTLYKIGKNFDYIQRLPPFQYQGSEIDISEIESKYIDSIGNFLGVPEEDCGWIEKEDVDWDITPTTSRGIAYKNQLKYENIDYACLVSYRPHPSKEGVERAIDVGKKYYKAVEKFDNVTKANYGVDTAHSRMVDFKRLGKRDIIKCELHMSIRNNIYTENNLDSEDEYRVFVNTIKNKYGFEERLIRNMIRDIISPQSFHRYISNY